MTAIAMDESSASAIRTEPSPHTISIDKGVMRQTAFEVGWVYEPRQFALAWSSSCRIATSAAMSTLMAKHSSYRARFGWLRSSLVARTICANSSLGFLGQ